jgi:hypothetical protein
MGERDPKKSGRIVGDSEGFMSWFEDCVASEHVANSFTMTCRRGCNTQQDDKLLADGQQLKLEEEQLQGETDITIAAARFIGSRNWRVLSIALPRGGSGLSFVPDTPGNQSIIPDVVALHAVTGQHIFIESKPKFSEADVTKLSGVKRGEYSSSIQALLGCESSKILLAIAFGGPLLKDSYSSLGLDFVFHYDSQGNIATLHQSQDLGI